MHVDSFLYTPEDVDTLVDNNILPTHRCLDCMSTNTQELNFISHSMDRVQLKFLFTTLLKDHDLDAKVVLDVGSRLGAVLYSAFAYSTCKDIRGIEINKHFCHLQNEMIQKLDLSSRIQVIQGDILSQVGSNLLQEADIVILNNVFQFFVNADQTLLQTIWKHMLHVLVSKPNQLIISVPSLEEQLEEAGLQDLAVQLSVKLEWLPLDPACYDGMEEEATELCSRICMYRVL